MIVDGPSQRGAYLKAAYCREKIWVSDFMLIDGFGLVMATQTVEPADAVTIPIHPPILPDGIYQNCKQSPVDGAVIRVPASEQRSSLLQRE